MTNTTNQSASTGLVRPASVPLVWSVPLAVILLIFLAFGATHVAAVLQAIVCVALVLVTAWVMPTLEAATPRLPRAIAAIWGCGGAVTTLMISLIEKSCAEVLRAWAAATVIAFVALIATGFIAQMARRVRTHLVFSLTQTVMAAAAAWCASGIVLLPAVRTGSWAAAWLTAVAFVALAAIFMLLSAQAVKSLPRFTVRGASDRRVAAWLSLTSVELAAIIAPIALAVATHAL